MSYENTIYNALIAGTPAHPEGLPPVLAKLAVAQSKHETGDYKSNAFITANNAFGYSYFSASPWQIGSGLVADNGQPVAKYKSIEDSAREMVDWIYRRVNAGVFPANLQSITTPEQYATYLKKAAYYGDTLSNYLAGLTRYFSSLPELSASNTGALLLLAIGIFVYLKYKN